MRLWMVAASLLFSICGIAQEKLDDRAYDSITAIVTNTKLTGDEAQKIVDALVKAAVSDKKIEQALIFRSSAARLIQRAGPSGSLLLSQMEDKFSDSAWNSFKTLNNTYRPDGVLPAARYSSISAGTVRKWLETNETNYVYNSGANAVVRKYSELREQGRKPSEALTRILDAEDPLLDSGLKCLLDQMQSVGGWALTGYDKNDAIKDTYGFLEGYYATFHPDAPDIAGVPKVCNPKGMISVRLVEAIRADNSHMMVPIRPIIDRARETVKQPDHKAPLGGYNLNGNWVEKGTTNRYQIVHEGDQVSIIRVEAKGKSPAGDVVFIADLGAKLPSGDFKSKGKCYPRGGERNHYDTSPAWDWYLGGFTIENKDYVVAEWIGGYSGSVCLVRVK